MIFFSKILEIKVIFLISHFEYHKQTVDAEHRAEDFNDYATSAGLTFSVILAPIQVRGGTLKMCSLYDAVSARQ